MATLQDYWNHPYFTQYRPRFYRAFCIEVAHQREINPGLSDSKLRRKAIEALQKDMMVVYKELGKVIAF